MKMLAFGVKNFRGFGSNMELLNMSNFTTLVGKNDAGKSSILDAMDLFFNGYKKVDSDDWHIETGGSRLEPIELKAVFDCSDFKEMKIENVQTSLEEEGFLVGGKLTILQRIKGTTKAGIHTYIEGQLPDDDNLKGIHSLKISELKKIFNQVKEENKLDKWDSVNQTIKTEMRKKLIAFYKESAEMTHVEISIDKEDGKSIWQVINQQLPVFQLFKVDRDNTDSDSEIQNPLNAIIKETLNGAVHEKLNQVFDEVEKEVEEQAQRTLDKLKEMDEGLANEITPSFDNPSWDKAFKFNLKTDEIPLNKRGSGTRRLILLNFFRAKAEENLSSSETNGIIYAFEEPETAQHADHQQMLMDSFQAISQKPNQQVIITTHSAELAGQSRDTDIHEVYREGNESKIRNSPNLLQVAEGLGMLANSADLPGKIKLIILVEGPNDVRFVKLMLQTFHNDIFDRRDVAIVPFGGGTFQSWVDLEVLRKFAEKFYCIFDNDAAGNRYVHLAQKKFPGVGVHQWQLGPVDCYFPYKIYRAETESINKSRKAKCERLSKKEQTDDVIEEIGKNQQLTVLKESDYHSADFKDNIKPLKGSLWSKFKKITKDGTFSEYLKEDEKISNELSNLSNEMFMYYDK